MGFKNFLPQSEFSKNVLTLMTGSTIATALPVAISPILTRIYTPEDMGILSVFIALSMVFGAIVNGRYELAVILPRNDDEAVNLFALSLIINFIISFILFLIVVIFHRNIISVLDNADIGTWLYYVPLCVFAIGFLNLLNIFNNRFKHYKDIAVASVYKSFVLIAFQIILGFSSSGAAGLIIGEFVSRFFANLKLLKNVGKDRILLRKITKDEMKAVLRKYSDFPKFDVPATLFNVSSFHVISILFTSFFSSSIAGFFYLTQRVLGAPVTLIATSIADVFKEKAARDFEQEGNARAIYLKTFKKLLILAFVMAIFLFFFIEDIFSIVFGEEWAVAGNYAFLMIPMLFLRFISNPLSFMFYIGEKQKLNMILQLFLFLGIISCFYIGTSDTSVVILLSATFSAFYITQIIVSAKIAKI